MAMAILVVTAILLPFLVRLVGEDIRWTQKSQATLEAQQGADFALSKAEWFLLDSTSTWNNILAGVSISSFPKTSSPPYYNSKDDVEYSGSDRTDTSFLYNAWISSAPGEPGIVHIIATARSNTLPYTYRSVEAYYSRYILGGLDMVGNFNAASSTYPTVHWGPMTSHDVVSGLGVNGLPLPSFPRMFSAGAVQGEDTLNNATNTDDSYYWAYERELEQIPQVDLRYYQRRAQNSTLSLSALGVWLSTASNSFIPPQSNPAGSCFFNDNANYTFGDPTGAFNVNSATSVIYISPAVPNNYTVTVSSYTFMRIEALVIENCNLNVRGGNGTINPLNPSTLTGYDPDVEYKRLTPATAPSPVNAGNVFLQGLLFVVGSNAPGLASFQITTPGVNASLVGGAYVNQMLLNNGGAGPQPSLTIYYQQEFAQRAAINTTSIKRTRYTILKGTYLGNPPNSW